MAQALKEAFGPRVPRSIAATKAGGTVKIDLRLRNDGDSTARAVVDFRIHFVKAGGRVSPKVFKLKDISLDAGQTLELSKRVSLAPMSTRRHYPGVHAVEAVINGRPSAAGSFVLRAAREAYSR